MKLYILVIVDRHTEPYIYVFDDKEMAIEEAKKYVKNNGREGDIEEDLTQMAIDEGWCYSCRYSCEGDFVYVQERILNKIEN